MYRSAAASLPTGSGGQLDLVSHWRLRAPAEHVWAALVDPAGWPGWWPCIREVRRLRESGPQGIGGVWRIEGATRLPFRIVIEVEAVESIRHRRLRGRSRGMLVGEGLCLLRAEDGCTDVTQVWRVRPAARWMRWFVPLLAPIVRWNHEGVMRVGEAGLRRLLERQAVAPHDTWRHGDDSSATVIEVRCPPR